MSVAAVAVSAAPKLAALASANTVAVAATIAAHAVDWSNLTAVMVAVPNMITAALTGVVAWRQLHKRRKKADDDQP